MSKIKNILMHIFISLVAIASVFPFFWMIIASTNTSVDVTRGKMSFGSHFFINLENLLASTDILIAFKNSTIIAIITTVLALLISSAAGYGFVIYKDKIKEKVFNILLLSMMIPFAAILIPLYRLFGQLSLLNSLVAVILPSVATAFLIFFFRQNTQAFPKELLEAGRVDGVSEFGLFVLIFIPTMKSTFSAGAIITFMNAWNNYLWPLVALQEKDKVTLPLIISNLNSSYTPDFGVIMVAIILTTIPTTIVFFAMQKHFVEGMLGSVK